MDISTVGALWAAYKERDISREIHPSDEMFNNGPEWYWSVGDSALQSIATALTVTWKTEIKTVLDFGCGHGRVARYIRALLPDAKLHFCERVPGAATFCAETFNGYIADEENLPQDMDLIWVGSVFTHFSAPDMRALFLKLAASLSEHGVLVATFHGRKCVLLKKDAKQRYISDEKWNAIVESYEYDGVGYADYDNTPGYGVSLTKPAWVTRLGESNPRLRLRSYIEAGWAEHQDVGVWVATPLNWSL